jgi:hypothetical protein
LSPFGLIQAFVFQNLQLDNAGPENEICPL